MHASRIDGVKAPQHRGTPSYTVTGTLSASSMAAIAKTCVRTAFGWTRVVAASFGGLSRRVRSAAGWLSQPLLIVHIGVYRVATKSLATRSRPRSFLRTQDRTQVFLLNFGPFPEAPFSEMVVELRDPVSRQTPNFLELRPPEASVETPAARERAKLPSKLAQNPNRIAELTVYQSSVRRRVRLKHSRSYFYMLFRMHRRPPESLTPCACVTEEHDPSLPPQRQIRRARAEGCYGDVSPVAAMAPIAAGEIFVADGPLFAARPRSTPVGRRTGSPNVVAATRWWRCRRGSHTRAHTQMQRDSQRETHRAPLCHAAR